MNKKLFPLFETTKCEKLILLGARVLLKKTRSSPFLCHNIVPSKNFIGVLLPIAYYSLKLKINQSLDGSATLEGYWYNQETQGSLLFKDYSDDCRRKIRLQWVDELLEYKGE